MQRILDPDLDAFVYGSEHFRSSDAPRLQADEHPPWDLSKVVDFLESRCRGTRPSSRVRLGIDGHQPRTELRGQVVA